MGRVFGQLWDQVAFIFYLLIYDLMAVGLSVPFLGGAIAVSEPLKTMGPLAVVSGIIAISVLVWLLLVPHWIAKEAAMRRVVHGEGFLQSFGSALRAGSDAVALFVLWTRHRLSRRHSHLHDDRFEDPDRKEAGRH